MRKWIFFGLILMWSPLALSFSHEDCGSLFPRLQDKHPPYFSPFYTLTMVPSTTSYLSSFGKCSMYGALSHQREIFVASAYEEITLAASQGKGEHLAALRALSGCASTDQDIFNRVLQNQYAQVFSEAQPRELTLLMKRMDQALGTHPSLRNSCALLHSI